MSFLFPKPKINKSPIDTTLIEPGVRGTLLPLSLGINRVSPVIGYVGDTQITVVETGSGGGKGGGGGTDAPTQDYYYQVGLHFLSIGQGKALTRILQGGKSIYEGFITPTTHPSGSSITLGAEGTFRIYWGETNQPIDDRLTNLTGLFSAFPYIMYIVWDKKTLGTQKQWPNLEYEIFTVPQQTTLFGNDPVYDYTVLPETLSCNILSIRKLRHLNRHHTHYTTKRAITTTDPDIANVQKGWIVEGIVNSISWSSTIVDISLDTGVYTIITQTSPPTEWLGYNNQSLTFHQSIQRGINPIAIMYQLLFETYPHGLGQSTDLYDLTDMETLFDYFDASATFIPISLNLSQGKSIKDGLNMVMQDCGILMGWDCITGKYKFTRPQNSDVASNIPEGLYSLDDAFEEIDYSTLNPEIYAYEYKDVNRKFQDSTILISNDGTAKLSDMPNVKKESLDTVRDITTASLVAAYRERENINPASLSLGISKFLLTSLPGGLFSFEGLSGNYRLIEKHTIPDNSKISCEFYKDVYSEPSPYVDKEPSGLFPEDTLGAAEDLYIRLLEINRFTNKDQNGVVFLRIRQHHQIQGTIPFLSVNDVTYNQYNEQTYAIAGGVLTEGIAIDGPAIITTGPEFNNYGPDISSVLDLSSADDLPSWKSGMQIALIDDEIFFLRGVSAVAGVDATYTLDGLIRARLGTVQAAHSVGAVVYIFNISALPVLTAPYLLYNMLIYGKSVPYTTTSVVDISDVDPVTLTYHGGGYRPLPCTNLNTVDLTSGYVSGTDVSLKWNYRNISGGAGAGLNVSDAVYHTPSFGGYFELRFLTTADVLKRIVAVIDAPEYIYSDANRISDFGSASFKVRVYNIDNGLPSEYDEITITEAGA